MSDIDKTKIAYLVVGLAALNLFRSYSDPAKPITPTTVTGTPMYQSFSMNSAYRPVPNMTRNAPDTT